ncbi:MAG: helix-turn-helix domain-containing protein [Actinomycetota bacterium]
MAAPPAESTTSTNTTSSIDRAFHLLQLVAAAGEPLGVRELGRRSGLPRSTVSRLAAQLIELGMLSRSGSGLASGPALATLVPAGAAPPAALEDRLRPLLVECVQRFGESAALTIDTPTGALYLTHVPGPSAVQAPDPTGEQLPFHVVAPGLALMTSWDTERLETYTAGPLGTPTPLTLVDPTELTMLIATGRANGSIWADQALDLEVNGVATVVPGAEPVAAISLYGPAYRLNPADRPELGAALRDLVAEWAPGLLGN